jgi:hypothetical protein
VLVLGKDGNYSLTLRCPGPGGTSSFSGSWAVNKDFVNDGIRVSFSTFPSNGSARFDLCKSPPTGVTSRDCHVSRRWLGDIALMINFDLDEHFVKLR